MHLTRNEDYVGSNPITGPWYEILSLGEFMSRILVTGGAGFIGSNLVDKLIELGNKVVVWDNLSTGKRDNVHPKAILINGDIGNGDCPIGPFDIIFHLAACARIQPSFKYPVQYHHSNVTGTSRILELATIWKCKVIYAGTSSLFHDPYANPYTFTKWLGEEYCKLYNKVFGVPVAITRFFNVYGHRAVREGEYATAIGNFEQQTFNKETLTIYGTGEKRRDFTHVNDIVKGLILASEGEWNGEIFSFGRGRNYSINEVVAMFKPINVKYLPDRPGEAPSTLADITFAKDKLGWQPSEKLEDYIANFLKLCDNAGN